MAKVSEIKFDLKGQSLKINVNCTSGGQFNAKIPKDIAEALRIDERITANTLLELTDNFNEKLKKYKNIQTTEELFILVAYQARGRYTYRKDGSALFGWNNSIYKIDISFSEIDNALGLDFFVAIKQTIDGKDKWFKAKLGSEFSHICKEYNYPTAYHKHMPITSYRLERFKIIPFNQKALDTLNSAQERFRELSEMLFNFISQDEEKILLTLTTQKLLTQ